MVQKSYQLLSGWYYGFPESSGGEPHWGMVEAYEVRWLCLTCQLLPPLLWDWQLSQKSWKSLSLKQNIWKKKAFSDRPNLPMFVLCRKMYRRVVHNLWSWAPTRWKEECGDMWFAEGWQCQVPPDEHFPRVEYLCVCMGVTRPQPTSVEVTGSWEEGK